MNHISLKGEGPIQSIAKTLDTVMRDGGLQVQKVRGITRRQGKVNIVMMVYEASILDETATVSVMLTGEERQIIVDAVVTGKPSNKAIFDLIIETLKPLDFKSN